MFKVKADIELKVISDIYLCDSEGNKILELGYYQDIFSKEFTVYITKENYEKLDLSKEYFANIDGVITYYGAKLKTTSLIEVTLNDVYIPLSKEETTDRIPINLEILEEAMDIYYLDDNKVYIIYYDFSNAQSYKLFGLTYDLTTNTTISNVQLERPEDVVVSDTQVLNSWNYGEYCFRL